MLSHDAELKRPRASVGERDNNLGLGPKENQQPEEQGGEQEQAGKDSIVDVCGPGIMPWKLTLLCRAKGDNGLSRC